MSLQPVAERILLVATSLFLLVAPFTGSAGWRAAMLVLGVAGLVALALTGRLEIARPLPRALLAAMAAWCALAVASLAWSVNADESLGELRRQLLYGAFAFLVFYLWGNPARWRMWWRVMLAGALVVVAAEALRSLAEPRLGLREWDGGGGALSTHLVILAPLLLPLAWSEREDEAPRVVLFVAALLLLFAAAWKTESRVVWPALLAAFAAAALAWRHAHRGRPRFSGARYIAVATLASIVALAALVSHWRSHVDLSARSAGLVAFEIDLRPRLWKVAVEEIGRAPWLGHGYGREIAAQRFRPEKPGHGHPEVLHAHNAFLNVALQLGLVGLALFVLVLALLGREFARALGDSRTCAAGILGLAVLAGFLAKNVTDDFLHRQNGLVFWAVMGMLLALARPRPAA